MGFEIDYIPVGEGERSGDAIALRFGNLTGPRTEQTVVVIDAGFTDSGEKLVKHINDFYGTNQVDLVVSTHPDMDHASGLTIVLEKMEVANLLMHKPWDHASDIKGMFKNGKITASGLEDKLEKSLQSASDLEALAKEKGISIYEPFQGFTAFNGAMHVLGPTKEFYQELLPHFRGTPEPARELSLLEKAIKMAEEAVKWIQDSMLVDLLNDDDDTTSPENNSSAVILFNIDGQKILFSGDAGKTALHLAADYAESMGIVLTDLRFFDVPHHGSKRNISSKLLKRIKAGTAFISAAKESPKHPAKKVTNALKKHGTVVYVTKELTIGHSYNSPGRGWVAAPVEPFHDYVEE
jgi:beta-lactamase superfamily II metal-dependent hydrolase